MEAAEGVFGGEFDHIYEEDDVQMAGSSRSADVKSATRMTVQRYLVSGTLTVC